MAQGQELIRIFPCPDLKKGVHTQNKVEFSSIAQLPLKKLYRINGVGEALTLRFNRGYGEIFVGSNGKLCHVQPVNGVHDLRISLMRREPGWDKDDAVKGKVLFDLSCNPEVSGMDRVKCASK